MQFRLAGHFGNEGQKKDLASSISRLLTLKLRVPVAPPPD